MTPITLSKPKAKKTPMSQPAFALKMKALYGWTMAQADYQYSLFLKGIRDHRLHDNTCYYLVTYD